ncbi:FAD binding domain protein [Ascobolus immersus RN42]|uniref:FAD binding domain protein n=1 Tax=Ascobolus immersus RN42 TaxID=1160509 RepID=A0A3N4HPE3_ASCIM|nr:FAD binding domain protein [Ascobolus immersus RN42]
MVRFTKVLVASLAFGLIETTVAIQHVLKGGKVCRYMPGDPEWPSVETWNKLNETVGGRLIKTVALSDICYESASTYDAGKCEDIKNGWAFTEIHARDPGSFNSPILQNGTDPFQTERPSSLGNLPAYTIDVRTWKDAAAGIKFAKENKVRLTIKNTGHDLLGKSAGAGSLSLWTHKLKTLTAEDYESPRYTGKAIRMGAGIQGHEAYELAANLGLRVVGGSCPSVGLAGGYTQGGGHGVLNNIYGLAADQVLEWEVVTASGQLVVATPEQNKDLYWALSGGGPGTFGVVMSMTVRAHPDGPVSEVSFTFTDAGISKDIFWAALEKFHTHLSSLHNAGGQAIIAIIDNVFMLNGVTFPDKDIKHVKTAIKPWLEELTELGIQFQPQFTTYPTYFAFVEKRYGPLPNGPYPSSQLSVSRLIPREVIEKDNHQLTKAFRKASEAGPFFVALTSLHLPNPAVENSVNPLFRTAATLWVTTMMWDFSAPRSQNLAAWDTLVTEVLPMMKEVTGGDEGASYLNEGTTRQADWRGAFFGGNLERLEEIKGKWDGEGVFWAETGVGSAGWKVEGGRLCRVDKEGGRSWLKTEL